MSVVWEFEPRPNFLFAMCTWVHMSFHCKILGPNHKVLYLLFSKPCQLNSTLTGKAVQQEKLEDYLYMGNNKNICVFVLTEQKWRNNLVEAAFYCIYLAHWPSLVTFNVLELVFLYLIR